MRAPAHGAGHSSPARHSFVVDYNPADVDEQSRVWSLDLPLLSDSVSLPRGSIFSVSVVRTSSRA